jgi:hypothetical protein
VGGSQTWNGSQGKEDHRGAGVGSFPDTWVYAPGCTTYHVKQKKNAQAVVQALRTGRFLAADRFFKENHRGSCKNIAADGNSYDGGAGTWPDATELVVAYP